MTNRFAKYVEAPAPAGNRFAKYVESEPPSGNRFAKYTDPAKSAGPADVLEPRQGPPRTIAGAEPPPMPAPAKLSLEPEAAAKAKRAEALVTSGMDAYTRTPEGIARLHAEAKAAGVPLGRAVRWKRAQLEREASTVDYSDVAGMLTPAEALRSVKGEDAPNRPITAADVGLETPESVRALWAKRAEDIAPTPTFAGKVGKFLASPGEFAWAGLHGTPEHLPAEDKAKLDAEFGRRMQDAQRAADNRGRVIELADQIQSSPRAVGGVKGEPVDVPGEDQDYNARYSQALAVLEAVRKRDAPQVPGDQFLRRLGVLGDRGGTAAGPAPVTDFDWGATAKGFAGSLMTSGGGALQMLGDNATRALQTFGHSALDEPGVLDRAAQGLSEAGSGTYAAGQDLSNEAAKGMITAPADGNPIDTLRHWAQKAVVSSGSTLMGMGVGALTANPMLGALLMGGTAAGQTYGDSAAAGGEFGGTADVVKGNRAAAFSALAETFPEKLSLETALGKNIANAMEDTLLRRTVASGVVEPTTEMITEAANAAYERFVDKKDITFDQFMARLKEAGIIGGLTGPTIGGGAHIAEHGTAAIKDQIDLLRLGSGIGRNRPWSPDNPTGGINFTGLREGSRRVANDIATRLMNAGGARIEPNVQLGADAAEAAFAQAGAATRGADTARQAPVRGAPTVAADSAPVIPIPKTPFSQPAGLMQGGGAVPVDNWSAPAPAPSQAAPGSWDLPSTAPAAPTPRVAESGPVMKPGPWEGAAPVPMTAPGAVAPAQWADPLQAARRHAETNTTTARAAEQTATARAAEQTATESEDAPIDEEALARDIEELRQAPSAQAQRDAEALGVKDPRVDFYHEPSAPPPPQDRARASSPIDLSIFDNAEHIDMASPPEAASGEPKSKEPMPTHAPDGRAYGTAPASAPPIVTARIMPDERQQVAGDVADTFLGISQPGSRAFQSPEIPAHIKSIAGLTQAVDPGIKVRRLPVEPNDDRQLYEFTMIDGTTATLAVEPDGVLQLDAQNLKEGLSSGADLYRIVNTFAHRNGLRALPDRRGLTEINRFRRTEQMTASALRTRTTQHLAPHYDQGVTKFREGGNDRQNTGELILAGMSNVMSAVPQAHQLRYNFDTHQFEWSDGSVAHDHDFAILGASPAARQIGAGSSTIKRAVLAASVVRESRAGRRGTVLGALGSESLQQLAAPALARILYRRASPVDETTSRQGDGRAPAGVSSPGAPAGKQAPGAPVPGGAPGATERGQRQRAPTRTAASLTAELRAQVGSRMANGLLGQRFFKIVNTRSEIDPDDLKRLDPSEQYQGVFIPNGSAGKGGNVYLIADEMDADAKVAAVMLHEVGVHYGLPKMLGRDFRGILEAFAARKDSDPKVKAAFAAVPESTHPNDVLEEALAYYVEQNWDAPKTGADRSLWQRITDAIKRFFNREVGVPLSYWDGHPEALLELARDAVRRASEGEFGQDQTSDRDSDSGSGPKASVPQPSGSPLSVDLASIPTVDIQSLLGATLFPTMADRTASGRVYVGIDGSRITVPVDLPGGPFFPAVEGNRKAGVGWALRSDKGVLGHKQRLIKEAGGRVVMAVALGSDVMHQSNTTIAKAYLGTMEAYVRDGRIAPGDIPAIDDAVRNGAAALLRRAAAKKDATAAKKAEKAAADAEKKAEERAAKKAEKDAEKARKAEEYARLYPAKAAASAKRAAERAAKVEAAARAKAEAEAAAAEDGLDNTDDDEGEEETTLGTSDELRADAGTVNTFPGFTNLDAATKFLDSLSFDARAAVILALDAKTVRALGTPNVPKVLRDTMESSLAGHNIADTVLLIDVTGGAMELGPETGTLRHDSYGYGMEGSLIGRLKAPVAARLIWKEWFDSTIAAKTKDGVAPSATRLNRGFSLAKPLVKVTQEMVDRIKDIEYKTIKSPKQAEAARDMTLGNWREGHKPVKEGGVSPQEFLDALAASDGSATLPSYTLPEVKAGIKKGTLKLYQLGDHQIFFGLKKGEPWYAGKIKAPVGTSEMELVSVINNEPGVPGIASPAIMAKAIEDGVTILDAYAVKSAKHPQGFLPALYGEFGFQKIGEIEFDPASAPGMKLADLKAFWSKNGWVEADGYPSIAVMRWTGKESDRAGFTSRYLREGADSLWRDQAGTADARSVRQASAISTGPERAEPGARDRNPGDQGAGDRAPLGLGAFRVVNELLGLTDVQLDNLGLTRAQVDAMSQRVKASSGKRKPRKSAEIIRTVEQLTDAARTMSSWRTWYDRHDAVLRDVFGSDADLFQKILSVTSQAASVPANVGLAIKAYVQLLGGIPFTGYLKAVVGNLERVRDDLQVQGAKISQYDAANKGDTDAIAVDRHIAMLFFDTKTPNAAQIQAAKTRIRDIAADLGWEPRQVQAALWAYNQTLLGTRIEDVQSYDAIIERNRTLLDGLRTFLGRREGGSAPESGAAAGAPEVPEGGDGRPAEDGRDDQPRDDLGRFVAEDDRRVKRSAPKGPPLAGGSSGSLEAAGQPRDERGFVSADDGEAVTSTRNEVTDAEREAVLRDPIYRDAVKTNESTLADAQKKVDADPVAVDDLAARLAASARPTITAVQEGMLLIRKMQHMNRRAAQEKILGDLKASKVEKENARAAWELAERRIAMIDRATYATGREWGRMGQFRQRLIRSDFTLEAMLRRERMRLAKYNLQLTKKASDEIAAKAEEIQKAAQEAEAAKAAVEAAEVEAEAARTYAAMVQHMARGLKKTRDSSARLKFLRDGKDDALAKIRAMLNVPSKNKQSGAVINPAILYEATRVGVYFVREIGVRLADWVDSHTADWMSRMREALGDFKPFGGEPSMEQVLKAAHEVLAATEPAGPRTIEQVMKSIVPEEIDHRDVYNLAEAVVRSGVRGLDPVMAAVTEELRKVSPDITEVQVRRLFSDYGTVKFPSTEEVKVELRHLREVSQLTEAIRDLEEGKAPKKSGMQRGDPAEEARPLRVRLNELLKLLEASSANDPTRLATYRDTRIANLKNQIKDLESWIAGAPRPQRNPAPEINDEMRRLMKERAALRAKLDKMDRERNQTETPEQRANRRRRTEIGKQMKVLEGRIAAKEAGLPDAPKRAAPVYDAETAAMQAQLDALAAQLRALNKSADTPEQARDRKRLEAIDKQIAEAEARIANPDMPKKAKPDKPAYGAEVTAAQAKLDAKLAELRAVENERKEHKTKEERYNQRLKTSMESQIKSMARQLQAGVRDVKAGAIERTAEVLAIADARADMVAKMKEMFGEQDYQAARGRAIDRRIAELEKLADNMDYTPRARPVPRPLTEENLKKQKALEQIKAQYVEAKFLDDMSKRPPISKLLGTAGETLHLSRAVMTSCDFSAPLRQGGFIVLGHPLRGARAMWPALKAALLEDNFTKQKENLAKRANANLYEEAGLELTKTDGYKLSDMEEKFVSRWLEWTAPDVMDSLATRIRKTGKNALLYLVRASNRGFVAFLNELRADSFDTMVAAFGSPNFIQRGLGAIARPATLEEMQAIANYINVATGRGKIGWNDKTTTATGLNAVFFAPRLVASRINLLAGQPLYAAGSTGRTRAAVAVEYARFAMGISFVLALGALAKSLMKDDDDEDEPITTYDPRSSSFLKMKFGNTYIDPFAGLGQVSTFVARVVTGETVNAGGKVMSLRDKWRPSELFRDPNERSLPKVQYGGRTVPDVIFDFARSKMAPAPGALFNAAAGEDMMGREVTATDLLIDLATPLSFQDVGNVMTDNGVPFGVAAMTLNLLGMGVQYREPRGGH